MEELLIGFGDLMIKLAEYIYSLTSGFINGEEDPPESMLWFDEDSEIKLSKKTEGMKGMITMVWAINWIMSWI